MSETLRYFNLNIPAPVRLQMLREAFANHAKRYPYCPERMKPKSWRDIRGATYKTVASYVGILDRGFNIIGGRKHDIAYTFCGPYFAREYYVDELPDSPIDHRGWYTDNDGRAKARGIVAMLPHGRFLAGYEWSDNGERVYFLSVESDLRDAIRAADYYAEQFAESEREYQQKYDEAREIVDIIENKINRLRECIALRNNPCFAKLRDEAREIIGRIRDMRKTLRTEYADIDV